MPSGHAAVLAPGPGESRKQDQAEGQGSRPRTPARRRFPPFLQFSKRMQGGRSPENVPLKRQILSAVYLLNHWQEPKIYTFFSGEK